MAEINNKVYLKVWGENACFTRPEMKVERVSYDVMTPSSARAILEAILWKPSIRWVITQIDVLKPIRWESVRRSEVANIISTKNVTSAMASGKGYLGLYIEDERQQRAGLFLRDVAYTIHARCLLTAKARPEDNLIKYLEMFRRRAGSGQCFTQPYLGCREFSAYFELVNSEQDLPTPIDYSCDLGWMLHDLDYSSSIPTPFFFRAEMAAGRIIVPSLDNNEVRA